MSETKPVASPGEGREKRDINVRKVAIYGTALLLVICLAGVGTTILVFKELTAVEERAPGSPFLETQPLPPEPRLQADPPLDLKKYRATEETQLHSYGWVDRTNGVVRIPIERALEIVVQNGLPIRLDATMEGPAAPDKGKPHAGAGPKPARGAERR